MTKRDALDKALLAAVKELGITLPSRILLLRRVFRKHLEPLLADERTRVRTEIANDLKQALSRW